MKKDTNFLLLIWAIFFVLLPILLGSCTTIKKVFSKHKSTTDSTAIVKKEEIQVKTSDSAHVKKEERESEGSIVIEFLDSTRASIAQPLWRVGDTPTIADPSFRMEDSKLNDILVITSDGRLITNKPIKKVTIAGKARTSKSDSTGVRQSTTTSHKSSSQITGSTKHKAVLKDVEKSRFPWVSLTVSLLLIALAVFWVLWLRRKKRQFARLRIPPIS